MTARIGADLHAGNVGRGHVVTESQIVVGVLCNQLKITRLHLHLYAQLFPLAIDVRGVTAAQHHIREEQRTLTKLIGFHHILRAAGVGICCAQRQHAADLCTRYHLMAGFDSQCIGHKHIVCSLILPLRCIGIICHHHAGCQIRQLEGVVDLVESHPVLDLILVALKQHLAVALKEADQLAVVPATVLFDQRQRSLEVRDCDHRFNAPAVQFPEHILVVAQTLLVGLGIVAVRENATPCNGGAQALHAHLAKHGNVFFVVMVEVDGFMGGIDAALMQLQRRVQLDETIFAGLQQVADLQALSIFQISALALICRQCAAP